MLQVGSSCTNDSTNIATFTDYHPSDQLCVGGVGVTRMNDRLSLFIQTWKHNNENYSGTSLNVYIYLTTA